MAEGKHSLGLSSWLFGDNNSKETTPKKSEPPKVEEKKPETAAPTEVPPLSGEQKPSAPEKKEEKNMNLDEMRGTTQQNIPPMDVPTNPPANNPATPAPAPNPEPPKRDPLVDDLRLRIARNRRIMNTGEVQIVYPIGKRLYSPEQWESITGERLADRKDVKPQFIFVNSSADGKHAATAPATEDDYEIWLYKVECNNLGLSPLV